MNKIILTAILALSSSLFAYPQVYQNVTPYSVEERTFVPMAESYIEWYPVQKARIVQQPVTVRHYYQQVERVIVNRILETNYMGTQAFTNNDPNIIIVPQRISNNFLNGRVYAPNPYNPNMYRWYGFACRGLRCRIPFLSF